MRQPAFFLAWTWAAACAGFPGDSVDSERPPSGDAGPPDTLIPHPRCDPTAGDPVWVEEGQEVIVKVSCVSGTKLDGAVFRLDPLPRGASWDAAQATMRWVPGLDQAAVYEIAILTTGGERGKLKIGVADRFDAPGNSPVTPASYTEEMGLPVFHLTVDPGITVDVYTPARLTHRGHSYKIDAKHRGNSSLAYPKKNFTLEFAKNDRFNEPDLAGGFVDKRRIVLRAVFDDNSYLRDRLSYALWNRIGAGKIRIQGGSAVVFVNGAYNGLYTVLDHIDEYVMEAHGLSRDGNIFKSLGPDANFYPHPSLWNVYEKVNGDPPDGAPGAYADLEELTAFMNEASDERFAAEIGRTVSLGDYTAWLILVTTIQAQDTLGKNVYHYHNPQAGPWRVVPWDFNHSFGQDWMTVREPPEVETKDLAAANRLFERLWNHPVLGPQTRERHKMALAGEIALDDVLAVFDGMAREIAPAAKRDERKWQKEYLTFERWSARMDFNDFDGEIKYVRQWIRDRWAFLAGR